VKAPTMNNMKKGTQYWAVSGPVSSLTIISGIRAVRKPEQNIALTLSHSFCVLFSFLGSLKPVLCIIYRKINSNMNQIEKNASDPKRFVAQTTK